MNTLSEMTEFINKLPSISDIRQNKALSANGNNGINIDPMKAIQDMIVINMKSFDDSYKAIAKVWSLIFKV